MKFTPVAISAALIALSASALADDTLPAYADHSLYPAALMTQGFFVSVDGTYSKDVLASGTKLSNGDKNPVLFNSPWGFSGSAGYETHLGQTGSLIAGVEGGYRYMGKLSFGSVAGSSNAAPKDFKLQAATGLVDLGLQMDRLDMIAKGGFAVELAGHYQSSSSASSTAYRFDTRVVPMAGGEVGFAVMPNLKFSAELDYIFGHQLNAGNLGTSSNTAATGGYRAITGLVGFTYYMN
jgi:hypothetical protein